VWLTPKSLTCCIMCVFLPSLSKVDVTNGHGDWQSFPNLIDQELTFAALPVGLLHKKKKGKENDWCGVKKLLIWCNVVSGLRLLQTFELWEEAGYINLLSGSCILWPLLPAETHTKERM
jgi:hypothetical protein